MWFCFIFHHVSLRFTCSVSIEKWIYHGGGSPSKSGKTEFVKNLINHPHWISPPPERIVWCYREWQLAYESLKERFRFIKDIPDDDEKIVRNTGVRHLLIFDDMMGEKAIQSIIGLRAKLIIGIPVWSTSLKIFSIEPLRIEPLVWMLII